MNQKQKPNQYLINVLKSEKTWTKDKSDEVNS